MNAKVIAWKFIQEDTHVYIIENNKVYFYYAYKLSKSFIEAEDFKNSEEGRVLDLLYWDIE